jgi:hypothetical protein
MEARKLKPDRRWPLGNPTSIAAGAALGLIVLSHLLWSSPGYRRSWLLAAAVLAVAVAGRRAWLPWRQSGWPGALALGGLLTAHLAAWIGAVLHEGSPAAATLAMGQGVIAVLGLAVLVAVLLESPWQRCLMWTSLLVLIPVLAGSLTGYFIDIDSQGDPGNQAPWHDTMRMTAIWPTRILTTGIGQIVWQHTNVAGYYFALALVLVCEALAAGRTRRRRPWWLLAGVLAAAVYLTASRGAGMMVLLGLPLVLTWRPPGFAARVLALLVLGILCGHAALRAKQAMVVRAATAQADEQTADSAIRGAAAHNENYLKRADSGRLRAYQELWRENQESPWFGRGLAAADKPLLYLNQEHSSILTTLRTSGRVGMAGHLLVLATGAWCAIRLLQRGIRWPAVLLVTAIAGILFDRTTVIAATGYYEFLAHWTAVAIPLLLARSPDRAALS